MVSSYAAAKGMGRILSTGGRNSRGGRESTGDLLQEILSEVESSGVSHPKILKVLEDAIEAAETRTRRL